MVPVRLPARLLRDAAWLTGERARVYGTMLGAGLFVMTLWLTVAPLRAGIPGGDFASFYAASTLALAGQAADAWRPDLHGAAEQAVLGQAGYLAFIYPPPYLLICWPLALLPFGPALAAWTVSTLGAALAGFAAFMQRAGATIRSPLMLFAMPAIWINVLAGQNGALSLALLATGFALLDRRPVVAGLVLGVMVYKPQLAIMLPVVLLLAERWRAGLALLCGAVGLSLLAWLAVGNDGYGAFLANTLNARLALEGGAVDPALQQSLFGMLQPISPPAAYAGQGLVSAIVLLVVGVVIRRARPDGTALGALAVAATLAATAFLLDYDLAIATLPIGWLVARGAASGFRSWEKLACLACGGLPLVSRGVASGLHLHLAPLLSLSLLAIVAGRILAEAAEPETRPARP